MKNYREQKLLILYKKGQTVWYIDRIEGICSHFSYYKSLKSGVGQIFQIDYDTN